MLQTTSIDALRNQVAEWRRSGERIVLVPTMGNLHPGHHSLIQRARTLGSRVVATIFVNPTQFGPTEDFNSYPRTLAQDVVGLEAHGCDVLFYPSVDDVYPFGLGASVSIAVPELSDILCGAFRPGHFSGVATVVTKLLNMVQPDVAVFGQKDYQQLMVIRRVVTDLQMPIVIESAATVREPSGLAMSSRNQYLTETERAAAAELHRTLTDMAGRLTSGEGWRDVELAGMQRLEQAGFRPDYAAVRRDDDLGTPRDGQSSQLVVLAAARLGKARLIDNILI